MSETPEIPKGAPAVRAYLSDALRYWEPRRVLFNAVLAAVVLACFFATWAGSRMSLSWDMALTLFALAVLANVCYCAAYVVDLFVQMSGSGEAWTRRRWVLLAIGSALAAVIARFIALALFSGLRVG